MIMTVFVIVMMINCIDFHGVNDYDKMGMNDDVDCDSGSNR